MLIFVLQMKAKNRIVFYDGDCGFCNHTVRFILLRNKKAPLLHFASLQSNFCNSFFKAHQQEKSDLSTIVFYENGRFYYASSAALKISVHLKNLSWLKIFWIVPKLMRDGMYKIIAKNRKRLLKQQYCFLPDEQDKKRFFA